LPREPAVSVVIPCHNSARFVGRAIESALAQTYPRVEVVLVDDGSTDDLASALAPYAGRIRVLSQPNRGPARTRNRGIEVGSSEFVAFLDADDVWRPEKIARQVAALEAHPECGLSHTRFVMIDEQGAELPDTWRDPRSKPASGSCVGVLARENGIGVSSVVARRSAIPDGGFDPETSLATDWDLWLRMAAGSPLLYIDESLMLYRQHAGSLSRDRRGMVRAEIAVFTRLLSRERDPRIRAVARRTLAGRTIKLAHLEYQHGDLDAARRLFAAFAPRLRPVDLLRYGAAHLPADILMAWRSVWRRLRGIPRA
jgi:glycosyltransferase involved in cell wall biosynthesis